MQDKKINCIGCRSDFVFAVKEQTFFKRKGFQDPKRCKECRNKKKELNKSNDRPDWSQECLVCGMTPVVPSTGMCGPCTFGEADTIGGNW